MQANRYFHNPSRVVKIAQAQWPSAIFTTLTTLEETVTQPLKKSSLSPTPVLELTILQLAHPLLYPLSHRESPKAVPRLQITNIYMAVTNNSNSYHRSPLLDGDTSQFQNLQLIENTACISELQTDSQRWHHHQNSGQRKKKLQYFLQFKHFSPFINRIVADFIQTNSNISFWNDIWKKNFFSILKKTKLLKKLLTILSLLSPFVLFFHNSNSISIHFNSIQFNSNSNQKKCENLKVQNSTTWRGPGSSCTWWWDWERQADQQKSWANNVNRARFQLYMMMMRLRTSSWSAKISSKWREEGPVPVASEMMTRLRTPSCWSAKILRSFQEGNKYSQELIFKTFNPKLL